MQYQEPALILGQKQTMSPQMYEQIRMLALPIQDLQARIQEELVNNPALETVEDSPDILFSQLNKGTEKEHRDEFDGTAEDEYPSEYSSGEDSKRKFLEGAVSRGESLQEHLLSQLWVQKIDSHTAKTAEMLIQNLDEDGFNREKPEDVVKNEPPETIQKAIELVSMLDPQGTCVSGYKDSLLIQAKLMGEMPEKTMEVIERYMELLEKGKYREIAQALNITESHVMKIFEFIRTLNPFPGRNFYSGETQYVIPDLMITKVDSEIAIYLNNDEIPTLTISPSFESLKNDKGNKTAKKFAREKIKEAQAFINILTLRNQTLLKTAEAITEYQKAFFLKGPRYLVPLTLKDIADTIGVHETTVSRIASRKYMQTDWGIFQLSYFFSSAVKLVEQGQDNLLSKESVKFMIKEIILENTGKKKLSDQKISDILNGKGIKLARRTVSKYRKELDIASSFER